MVEKLDIKKNVIFTGKVPWEEVPMYYNLCDVFATASKTETQGLTVIEAMASGKPVICVDDESFRNVVVSDLDGFIFKNKAEYKNCINILLKDENKRKKMGNQARISSEVYSSKYFAQRVLEVYKQAINNKKKGFIDKIKGVIYGKK